MPSQNDSYKTWTSLSSVAESTVTRISYYVLITTPIFAAIYSAAQHLIPLIDVSLPTSLLMTYFAALMMSIGRIIYEIHCPQKIQKYRTLNSYVSSLAELSLNCEKVFDNYELDERSINFEKTKSRFLRAGVQNAADVAKILEEEIENYQRTLPEALVSFRREVVREFNTEWEKDNLSNEEKRTLVHACFRASLFTWFIVYCIDLPIFVFFDWSFSNHLVNLFIKD